MNKVFWATAVLCWVLINPAKADQNYYPKEGQIRISGLDPSENSLSIRNIGDTAVDLAGWVFYDENDSHELFLTESDIVGNDRGRGLVLDPGSKLIITGKNDSDFRLYNAGGEVRLFSGPVEIDGTLEDKVNYPAIAAGESYQIIGSSQDQTPEENSNDNSNDLSENSNKNSNEDTDSSSTNPNNPDNIGSIGNINKNDYVCQIPENGNNNFNIPIPENQAIQSDNADSKSENNSNKREKSALSRQSREVPNPFFRNTGNNTPDASENNNSNVPTFTASSQLEKSPWGWFYWLYYSWFLRRIIIPLLVLWLALYLIVLVLRKKLSNQSE